MSTAYIAGATGLVGSYCLRRLRERYQQVIPLVRKPGGLQGEQPIDFDRIDNVHFVPGADLFCALGTTIRKAGSQDAFRKVDVEYVVALARRAAECGIAQFVVVSSAAADANTSNFYLRCKAEMERNASELPFRAVHIFRPSLLLGDRAESRPMEKLAIGIGRVAGFAFVGPLRVYHPVEADTVAAAMVRAAKMGSPGVHVYEYDEILRLSSQSSGEERRTAPPTTRP